MTATQSFTIIKIEARISQIRVSLTDRVCKDHATNGVPATTPRVHAAVRRDPHAHTHTTAEARGY